MKMNRFAGRTPHPAQAWSRISVILMAVGSTPHADWIAADDRGRRRIADHHNRHQRVDPFSLDDYFAKISREHWWSGQ